MGIPSDYVIADKGIDFRSFVSIGPSRVPRDVILTKLDDDRPDD